jgi:hypothetical protein
MRVEKVTIENNKVSLELSILNESNNVSGKTVVMKIPKNIYQRIGSPKIGEELSDEIDGVPSYWRTY